MIFRKIRLAIIVLFSAVFIATILQFAVFALPTERMERNVKKSVGIFQIEGAYRDLIPGIYTTKQDNYTDSAMLLQAIYNGDEPFVDRVMNDYCNMTAGKNYTESLILYSQTGQSNQVHSYYWYWHGYLTFLKPLLLFFDYGNIRILNGLFQLLLVLLFVWCLSSKGYSRYILPFGAALFVLSPATISLSLQFSACYYIMLISSMVIINYYDKLEKSNLFYMVFFLTGIATSFFDFLTYPVLTIGMPLIFYFILNKKNSVKLMVQRFIEYCLFWGIGYIAFWAGKWIVASVLLQKNCLAQGLAKITQHTSMDSGGLMEEAFTISDVFYRNFLWITQNANIVILSVVFLYLLIMAIRAKISKPSVIMSIPILVIALFPIGWYIIASTHAYFHYWMEYRHCALIIFAPLAALVKCREKSL